MSDAYEKRRATVMRKGAEAFAAGLPESSCPYEDHRQDSGKLTWSRAYRNDWVQGYRHAAETECKACGKKVRLVHEMNGINKPSGRLRLPTHAGTKWGRMCSESGELHESK